MDLKPFLGYFVEVSIFRKQKYKVHRGRLTVIRGHEIELFYRDYNGKYRNKWISKPRMSKDSIKKISMELKK